MTQLVTKLMPAGLGDMVSGSPMLTGDAKAADPAAQKGLLDVELDDAISMHLVFASEGDDVNDYTEGPVAGLPALLVPFYTNDTPLRGDPRLVNFWKALLSADEYFGFQDAMRGLASAGKLDARSALATLQRFFPRFPGDHMGVLAEQPGKPSLLDYLTKTLPFD